MIRIYTKRMSRLRRFLPVVSRFTLEQAIRGRLLYRPAASEFPRKRTRREKEREREREREKEREKTRRKLQISRSICDSGLFARACRAYELER